jgi:hypothetical protein
VLPEMQQSQRRQPGKEPPLLLQPALRMALPAKAENWPFAA